MEWIRNIFRSKKQEEVEVWKSSVLSTLLEVILPKGTPYIYQCAPSFLQPETLNTRSPVRIDLFLQECPLAIDLLGPQHSDLYKDAAPYISRPNWEELQRDFSRKKKLLSDYRCPYFTISYGEPIDFMSLIVRLEKATGYNFTSMR